MDCIDEEKMNSECSHIIVQNNEYQSLQEQVKNKVLNSTTYQGEKKVYTMENIIIQVSKYEDQNDEDNSIIDLGKCEETLRKKYFISDDESLIIFKSDIKGEGSYSTFVQYEVYHPNTLEPLPLSDCSEDQISISVSVNLSNETKSLLNSLSSSGHNLFDKSDSFYNDICVTYTTENGTDMSMTDRQHAIENSGGSLNLCQIGCELQSFNYTTQKAKCDCNITSAKTIKNIDDIEFSMDFLKISIFEGFKYSNYLVIKCYKLLLDMKLLQKNIGFIFMSIVFFSLLLLFFIYIFKERKKIEYYIQSILKNKSVYMNNRRNLKNNNNNKNIGNKNNNKNISNNKNKNDNKKLIIKTNKKNLKNNVKKEPIKKNNNAPPLKKNKRIINKNSRNLSSFKNLSNTNDDLMKQNAIKNLNINIIPIHNINYEKSMKGKNDNKKNINIKKAKSDLNIYKLKNTNNKNIYNKNKNLKIKDKVRQLKTIGKHKKILDIDYINYQTLNIHELNNLEYRVAIIVDKRTFLQFYINLIRKKQLIIFTFIPIDDYNLVSLKISLFLLSFSLYMTVNAFFFTDNTMHQIYTSNGKLDLLKHIPQIIYSSLISSVVNTILKQLSLSEDNILSIKQAKQMKISIKRAKTVQNYLHIKFFVFFIVSFLLILFYWYFISCFCAVYTNTQIILIKDSLISFGISMLYPFGISLIPGFFRIPALRAKNKDKVCIYKISQLAALI